ncbi:amino acid adenylation domain-containing protein, partial [Pseudomonas sp. AF32]|uniref:non-ribosomal peptide synthetase n=1 Tax=Pseudomonas sp. AF32 TaxID=554390 RepID=UPI001EED823C
EDVPGDKRLVAYFTESATADIESLRRHLQVQLPEYMVPVAYVRLDALPLTPNGKLDRKALPAPDQDSVMTRGYEAPQGEIETTLAQIWQELLQVEHIGRHDHFFELGGHSLMAVSLIERMRQAGLSADVRILFSQPTLAALAKAVGNHDRNEVTVPANLIPTGCETITPAMLPLVSLSQEAIDRIVATVPGGAGNVQDIYPLAPLQEGILYHYLAAGQGDPYVLQAQFAFDSRERFDAFTQALQAVIDRHDILRTSMAWEGLDEPVQVVWREAVLGIEQMELCQEDGDIADQLQARFDARHHRMDIRQAPLMCIRFAEDAVNQRWVATLLFHHMALDHTALEVVRHEMQAHLLGQADRMGEAVPYRNYVAQARLGVSREEHEEFFREMLGGIAEPTLPFGLQDVRGDGSTIEEARQDITADLSRRLRRQARQLGVSAASLHHLAWAQVLSRVSGREDVVFGTVLMGRMQGGDGADRALGMFINTLPIGVRLGEQDVRAGVRATHDRLTGLLGHEHASLALAQRCSGVAAPTPLFSALLNYRHSVAEPIALQSSSAWQGIEALGGEERTNYPLTLSVDDLGEGFSLTVQVQSRIGAQRICGYMSRALESLADALEQAPQAPLHSLDILPATERRQLLETWNATAAVYADEALIHRQVEAQAVAQPEATAVVHEGRALTYGELNTRANRVAHRLLAMGVRPDDRVAICVERGLDMIVGLLGILKAGAGYVPVDPAYPAERIAYMLEDSAPVAVLVHPVTKALMAGGTVPVLDLEHDIGQDGEEVASPQVPGLDPSHLVYVIYTSGSTGLPKGVMVEHRNLNNLVGWHCQAFDVKRGSRTSSVAGFGFDAAAWEIWPALCVGATLLLPPAHAGSDNVDALLDWWQAQALDVCFLPTPIAEYAFGRNLGHDRLRTLLIGGDRLRKLPVDPGFTLINNYGPTETTVVATSGRIDAGGALHIGKPVGNTRVYLLDAHLQPVPVGATGELYIGGAGVARGYLNRPELTAERFVRDPFSPVQHAKMYRTGDLGRYLPDGYIDYLGRNDGQLKIRGLRIELGEIESRLGDCPGVREAVVLALGETPDDMRLVAYYTAHEGEHQDLTADNLRARLQVHLPRHMVPSAYVRLDALPLTANGKLDRRALPAPDSDAYSSRGYEAPVGEMETRMADIWCRLLGVEQVGRHDDFFELGGHSLLAVRLMSQVRQQLDVELSLAELFANPVLMGLSAWVTQATASTLPSIGAVSRNEPLPLSFAQQRLWFLAQMEGGSAAYHICGGLRLNGRLAPQALRGALDRIVARHEALRTTFDKVGGDVVQRIAAEESGFALTFQDLSNRVDAEDELARLAAQEAHAPFDLQRGPLIRGRLVRLAQEAHVLLVTMHHIVSDGWSMGVLTRELGALYQACLHGAADPLPPLLIQYADFAVWQRRWLSGEVLSEQSAYWQRTLADAPPLLTLPADRPRPAQQDYAGATLPVIFDEALTADLKVLSQRHGTTLYMTVLAAWAAVLGRLSGQDTVVIGSPTANRRRAEVEELIGFFVNTLAVPIDVSGRPSVETLLQRVKAQTLSAQAHQDLPFEQVVERVKPVRSLSHSPLFQAMLAWQAADGQSLVLEGLSLETVEAPGRSAKFDVSLNLGEVGGLISGTLEYATALFDQTTMERYLGYLERMLRAMVADARAVVSEIVLPGDAERRQLDGFNATQAEYPLKQTVHGLFEAQVERTPEALAVLHRGQRLGYRELNERANRLAHYLRKQGVQPDSRVAICVERGLDMVVGLLAILKAGGGYVPLDPAYPADRIAYMLEDSAPAAVVAQAATVELLAGASMPVIDLNSGLWQDESVSNPQVPELTSSHLAYVIYTSGSTGLPKGVMIEHRNTVNFLTWAHRSFDSNILSKTLFSTSLNFDLAVYECFAPLTSGGSIEVVTNVLELHQGEHDITLINTVPSALKALLEAGGLGEGVDTVNVAGEALKRSLVEALFEQTSVKRLCNLYGPSETTTYSSWVSMAREDGFVPHIGKPVANTQFYLLDEHRQPVPLGVPGEIYIGGAGVARGYLNRDDLTAERFLKDPFSAVPNARMYKTGDLGRYLPDGNIEYLGRNDDQVKIRGFRIELGEIEARLA